MLCARQKAYTVIGLKYVAKAKFKKQVLFEILRYSTCNCSYRWVYIWIMDHLKN